MKTIKQMKTALEDLERRGQSSGALYDMKKEELGKYHSDLSDFLGELPTLEGTSPDQIEETKAIKTSSDLLKGRLDTELGEREKWEKTWKGKLGIKRPRIGPKEEMRKESAPLKEGEQQRFKEELEKIKQERAQRAAEHYEPTRFSSDSRQISTNAVDEFRHALIPPLVAEDIDELQKKRDALDVAKAVRNAYPKDCIDIHRTISKVKHFAKDAASVLGEFVEETTGGVLKATALFFGWPLLLPIKLANQAFMAAKYAFCFVDGILGSLETGLDNLIGKLKRTSDGEIENSLENIAKRILYFFLKKPISLIRTIAQIASVGCRWLERNIDADKWCKRSPIAAGFAIGGIGAVVLIALVLASIPGLGIPLAMAAFAFAAATVGALLHGYFKAKARAKELSSLELNSSDATKLEKYEYDHRLSGPTVSDDLKSKPLRLPTCDLPPESKVSTPAAEEPKPSPAPSIGEHSPDPVGRSEPPQERPDRKVNMN